MLITILLAGCTLAPEYLRPASPVPADWPQGTAYPAIKTDTSAPAAADLPWRTFFPDERLQKIIATALANNRDLRLAALNVEKARAMYGIQRAELLPSVSIDASGSKGRIPADLSTTGSAITAQEYRVNLGVISWEADFFGRIRSLKDRMMEEYLATDQARRSSEILLISSVAAAYYTLAADRENLHLAKSTFTAHNDSCNLIRKRYEVGMASALDLSRVQSQVESARSDVARYTQLAAQDENALNLLTGSPVANELLPPDLTGVTGPRNISAGVSSEILLSRPDVLAAEHRLKAASANIGAARAAFFPRISLSTTIGTASAELSGLFKDGSSTWSFAPQISMPIFDARTWSAYEVTKIEKEIAVTQYEKVIQTAFRETADTLAVQGTLDEQMAAQKSLIRAVAETHRLSDVRYMKGIESYLSVLDAQRSLNAAQQGMNFLHLARLNNLVTLYKVLGGGNK